MYIYLHVYLSTYLPRYVCMHACGGVSCSVAQRDALRNLKIFYFFLLNDLEPQRVVAGRRGISEYVGMVPFLRIIKKEI